MSLTVAGNVECVAFQEARLIAESLSAVPVEVVELLETEWEAYASAEKRRLGGAAAKADGPLVVHSVEGFIGGPEELRRWAGAPERGEGAREEAAAAAAQRYREALAGRDLAFLTFEGAAEGTVVFELRRDLCPRACDNFQALCAADEGGYRGTELHRVTGGWIQGGDVVDSSGAHSVAAGGGVLPDECFTLKHTAPLTLSMCNDGRHTNGSQFFVTLSAQPSFDGRFQAIGRVVRGAAAVRAAAAVALKNERPAESVRVAACGRFSVE